MQVLTRPEWTARAQAHADRLDRYLRPHLERRRSGVKHPVHDFLFDYYSQRPAALARWHPGYGVTLADAPEYDGLKGYEVSRVGFRQAQPPVVEPVETFTAVGDAHLTSQRPLIEQIHTLLSATASRPPTLGCFGLHEWAMVYRADRNRHAWPLRLGPRDTDEVVEAHRIGCSHFDAFRFFTEPARPLNTLQPGRDDRPVFEQPGCLHAGMDLYKHAFRLTPLISSDLVADAFELAWDIRILDMRAAPYDFSGVTLDPTGEPWTPIAIETAEGKQEYVVQQRDFADRAAPIRERLVQQCARLLEVSSRSELADR